MNAAATIRDRNDPRQYDDLVGAWWQQDGPFAALHWLARARARLIPPPRAGDTLVDLGVGGGVMAPFVNGYRHVGVDITRSALEVARNRAVVPIQADARRLPLRRGSVEVVVAGEVFEHVSPIEAVVAEIARVLRPGGTVVFDTINDTRFAKLALVTVGERMPGGPPPRIHDPHLFVDPAELRAAFAREGVDVELHGLRPSLLDYARFLWRRNRTVRMLRTRSLNAVYAGVGRKRS